MNDKLIARVRVGPIILIEQELHTFDSDDLIETLASSAGAVTAAAVEHGAKVLLEVMDPDGDIAPPGVWIALAIADSDGITRLYE